jgi:methylthioribose-1-phosphate isomerase
MTTIDFLIASGEDIPIEERSAREITHIGSVQITPDDIMVANPAFDVTPAQYITAIITDRGVATPPYQKSLTALIKR